MIYEMIIDNIELRKKINSYIEGITEQTNQKLENYAARQKRKANHQHLFGNDKKSKKSKNQTLGGGDDSEEEKQGEFRQRKDMRAI
jgi:hypothetical protein